MTMQERARVRPTPAPMGRPRVLENPRKAEFIIEAELLSALELLADDREISRNELVRNILHDYATGKFIRVNREDV